MIRDFISVQRELVACSRTDLADGLAVRQVVRDDLAELGEMPAIPLTTAHDVVVQLLIQVIQEGCERQRADVPMRKTDRNMASTHVTLHSSSDEVVT